MYGIASRCICSFGPCILSKGSFKRLYVLSVALLNPFGGSQPFYNCCAFLRLHRMSRSKRAKVQSAFRRIFREKYDRVIQRDTVRLVTTTLVYITRQRYELCCITWQYRKLALFALSHVIYATNVLAIVQRHTYIYVF